jgi:hypothetical protein
VLLMVVAAAGQTRSSGHRSPPGRFRNAAERGRGTAAPHRKPRV